MAKMKFFFCTIAFLFMAAFFSFAQAPDQHEQLRIQVWASLDEFPGSFEEQQTGAGNKKFFDEKDEFKRIFGFAIERSREIAPFLMSGLISGWKFDYVPGDKKRKVEEFWEFSEVEPFNSKINELKFISPKVIGNRLVAWVYCDRTPEQVFYYNVWESIVHPHVKGTGRASVEKGFEGIKEAAGKAAKDAVREYWRTIEKNKPKEIEGTLLIIRHPRIYVLNGQYVVELDFFLETDRIVKYQSY